MLGWLLWLAPVEEPPRPAALELAWQAPASCPDAEAVQARIDALAEVDPDGLGTLLIDGRVEPSSRGYRLTLKTTYAELADEHVVEDADCDALVEATALFVSVSLDPSGRDAPPRRPPELQPEPETVAGSSLVPGPAPEVRRELEPVRQPAPATPRPVDRRKPVVVAAVAPVLDIGSLPRISGGPRVSVGLQWPRVGVAMDGSYVVPQRTDAVQGAAGLVQLATVGARGCGAWSRDAWRVPACALVEVGALDVASRGLNPANRLRYAWLAAGVRTGVSYRWSRLGLFASAELLLPIARAEVLVGEAVAFSSSPAIGRLLWGIEIVFATGSA